MAGFARLKMRMPSLEPPSRYRNPLVSSMATLWVAVVPGPVTVATRLTSPLSMFAMLTTWMPEPPSLTM